MVANVTASFQNEKYSAVLGGVSFRSTDYPIQYDIRLSATSRNPASQQASVAQYNPMDSPVGWQTDLTYPILQLVGPRAPWDDPFDGAPGGSFLHPPAELC